MPFDAHFGRTQATKCQGLGFWMLLGHSSVTVGESYRLPCQSHIMEQRTTKTALLQGGYKKATLCCSKRSQWVKQISVYITPKP